MKNLKPRWPIGLAVISMATVWLAGCESKTGESLYDPNAAARLDPTISSITPSDGTFAGIGILTIAGQNFSATAKENQVYFDDQLGQVMQASATQLLVKAPNLVKNGVTLKIAVYKAAKFSNTISYNLVAAVAPLYDFSKIDEPWSITTDQQENVFASVLSNGAGVGVQRLAPDGSSSTPYSPKPSGTPTRYNGMKFGTGGFLYGVTFERRISQIPPGGGTPVNWVVLANTAIRLNDLDFDRDGNMWAAGSQDLHRIKPDKTAKFFPFIATVRTVRVFNGAVYLGGSRDAAEKIWRVPIVSADEVGPEEVYFDFGAHYNGTVQALTFAADGDLLVGTDATESIVVVHAGGSSEPLYPGLFSSGTISFAWGSGNYLYATRQAIKSVDASGAVTVVVPQTILKINMLKTGAPYYGRGD